MRLFVQAAPQNPMLPGMPPNLAPNDIYAADKPGNLSPVVRNFPSRIYVPNNDSNTVTVITVDPAVAGSVTGSGGWLYNATTGNVWIDNSTYYTF